MSLTRFASFADPWAMLYAALHPPGDLFAKPWPPPTPAGEALLARGWVRVTAREYAEPIAHAGRRFEVTATDTGRPPQRFSNAVFIDGECWNGCTALWCAWWRVDGGSWQRGLRSFERTKQAILAGEIGGAP